MALIVLGALIVVGIIVMLIFRSRSIKVDARKLDAQRKSRE
jgi:hypothetical protein